MMPAIGPSTKTRIAKSWLVVAVATSLAGAAHARDPERPVTDREPDVVDVAKTPMTDLNIAGPEIPALLIEAQQRPYTLDGLQKCTQLTAAIGEFDRVLGPDLDLPQEERGRLSQGRIAQWVVGSFIPFRGLIRELSGANRQDRKLVAAIQAGLARRGFLKGVGAARKCRYPASPATEQIVAQHIAEREAEKNKGKNDGDGRHRKQPRIEPDGTVATAANGDRRPAVQFKSEPVVQPLP